MKDGIHRPATVGANYWSQLFKNTVTTVTDHVSTTTDHVSTTTNHVSTTTDHVSTTADVGISQSNSNGNMSRMIKIGQQEDQQFIFTHQ